MMKHEQLAEYVYWIGKIDDREVPFHRLVLTKGTTYNAYLLKTDKPTLIDTVDFQFAKEFVNHLSQLIDPKEIQYIVVNHTEPDHSGGIAALAHRAPDATFVCTEMAVDELKEMYRLQNRQFLVVEDGDTLDIGGKTLKFKETPYLHTEETMITYSIEDKILFPCDIFSTHIAIEELYNDEVDMTDDFLGYYQAIIHPHRRYVKTLMEAMEELDVQLIAPSHGYLIRKDVEKFVNLYAEMSADSDCNKKVTIIYTTIRNNTRKIAHIMQEKLEEYNIEVAVFNADRADHDEILDCVAEADAVFIGSSTKYADLIGGLEDVLKKLKEINLEGKIAAAFGSYGWSGEAIEVIQDYLKETNMNVQTTAQIIKTTGMTDVEFPIRIRFSPNDNQVKKIEDSASYVADLLRSTI
ncbi:flavoprotein [Ammoniphilus oxalaticus]|uniref:Flavoprotein n=1 Tax=Ammoniphilus oxalaticus TaxID=66863 RepID=A0A419SP29_9BACL|nr:FprA family A-type flavoprotein [Ammoniphilus oxalaticus]RKD26003.1 flavoprotein [Ammoniphilus oxalaticus]